MKHARANPKAKARSTARHKAATIIGIVLCVVLVPVLLLNIYLIVCSFVNQDEVPSLGGVFPLIVKTDSMYPDIQGGDLIFCRTQDPAQIKEGDYIAFFDPAGNGTTIVTHSVAEITQVDGQLAWITRGIANNTNDAVPVPADKLAGVYWWRVPGLGNAVLFMQSPTGLILCVACPVALLIGWDIFRRRVFDKRRQAETEALLQELQDLRSQEAAAPAQTEQDNTKVL